MNTVTEAPPVSYCESFRSMVNRFKEQVEINGVTDAIPMSVAQEIKKLCEESGRKVAMISHTERGEATGRFRVQTTNVD